MPTGADGSFPEASGRSPGPLDLARALGACALALGLLALSGWLLGLERLQSVVPGAVAMNPTTALGMALTGGSILLFASVSHGAQRAAALLAAAAVLLGLVRLGEYAGLWHAHVDNWLFPTAVAASGRAHMGLFTAVDFVLQGSGLLLMAAGRPWPARWAAPACILVSAFIALVALIGHLYSAAQLHGPMAINTAGGFLASGVGFLLLQPTRDPVALLRSPQPGGELARRLWPALVLFPVGLGWLRLAGERSGLYRTTEGVALLVVSTIAMLVLTTWWAARAVERSATRQQQTLVALRESEAALRRSEESLHRHAAELEIANIELDAFAYSVSHDLRAPLRSIDGFTQAFLEDFGGALPPAGREQLDRVRNASQRMAGLIDDLLNLSRVTRAPLEREAVDLSGVVESAIAELRRREPDRVVDAVITPGVTGTGDPRLLRVVLENLVDNAWKYTGKLPRARLEFGIEETPRGRAYVVRDDGAGFDMSYAGKLFKPFQRLHGRGEFEGSGIGLATVERVIRRHGGQIWAEAEPGRGARFYFTL